SAMHTDVPGATVGLIDALAAVGIRYLSAAHNWAGRSVPYLVGGQALTRPFWWRAPSGNRLLVWHTDTPHGIAYMEGNLAGLAAGYDLALDLIPAYLSALASRPWPYGGRAFGWSGLPEGAEVTMRPYPHDIVHLRVQGSDADNAGPSVIPASIVREWNQTWAFPRLRMATNHDFLAAAEERLGDALDEFEGDWTDWWADGLGSGARPLGYARRAQRNLQTAETLHALADVRPPAEEGDRVVGTTATTTVDATYDKLALFDEHSWGSANPWTDGEEGVDSGAIQWARKASFAHDGADDALDLLHAGIRRFGATFARSDGALASVVVFNPSSASGPRTDLAEVWVPASVVDPAVPLALLDGRDGTPVPLLAGPPETVPFRPRGRRLRFVAKDLPPLGYARLDLVTGPAEAASGTERAAVSAGLAAAGPGSAGAAAIAASNGVVAIENEFYRVGYDLTEGFIASVFDKVAGRELVNQEAVGGLNQYVRDRYATAPHFNHLSGHVIATDLTLLGGRFTGHGATVVRAERTPVGERLEVELHGDGTDWIRTVVELPRGVRRVDLTNRIAKIGGAAKESVFFAFPFALRSPPAAWELAGGIGGSDLPRVPGSAHYLQYLRHWVAFEEPGLSLAWATLEAPLVQFGNIHLPYAPFPPSLDLPHPEPATIWSWAMNNIWDTNFPSEQRGETTFRYALTSVEAIPARELGPAAAAGLVEPPVAVLIGGPAPAAGAGARPAAPAAGTFVTVSDPLVEVTSLGRSRHGHALVVRLRSLAPETVEATLTFPLLQPSRAFAGTLLEEGLAEVAVEAEDGAVRVRLPACGTAAVTLDL
ncbi:MAG TPA: glycoside hydrolase family 38 C-terminal domain-containing protein, partial [Actinomycetota bacterium]